MEHRGMGQMFKFACVGRWNIVQVRMLHRSGELNMPTAITFTLFFAALQDGCQDMADYMFKFKIDPNLVVLGVCCKFLFQP